MHRRLARPPAPRHTRRLLLWCTVIACAVWSASSGTAGAGGGGASSEPVRVRLLIASFASPARAEAFAREHQLAWNECVLGKELGVVPPGMAQLPERCTAGTEVLVLEVQRARVGQSVVHRVVTTPFDAEDSWGPLTAYRLAGFDPLVIK